MVAVDLVEDLLADLFIDVLVQIGDHLHGVARLALSLQLVDVHLTLFLYLVTSYLVVLLRYLGIEVCGLRITRVGLGLLVVEEFLVVVLDSLWCPEGLLALIICLCAQDVAVMLRRRLVFGSIWLEAVSLLGALEAAERWFDL